MFFIFIIGSMLHLHSLLLLSAASQCRAVVSNVLFSSSHLFSLHLSASFYFEFNYQTMIFNKLSITLGTFYYVIYSLFHHSNFAQLFCLLVLLLTLLISLLHSLIFRVSNVTLGTYYKICVCVILPGLIYFLFIVIL